MTQIVLPRRATLGLVGGTLLAGGLPARAQTKAKARGTAKDVDVVIVGAGLSGMIAALILEEQGHSVCVVEAKNRVGGRCYTLADLPGKPEAGGSSVGSMYARFLDWCDRLGVKRTPEEGGGPGAAYRIGGQTILRKDWADHPLNPFAGADRQITPDAFRFRMLDRYKSFGDLDSWADPSKYKDDTSVYALMKAKGHSDAAIALGMGANPGYGHTPYDLSSVHMFHVSNFAASQMLGGPPNFWAIDGGNSSLPRAMRKALKGDLVLGCPVAAVRADATHAEVIATDGRRFRGRRAIFTLPFSALRFVDFDPILDGAQAEAVNTLPYGTCWHAYLSVASKFWEADGLPPGLWSDDLVGRINAVRAGGEIVGMYVFLTGRQAMRLNRLPMDAAKQAYMTALAAARPSTKGAVKMERAWSWVNDPYAGGMYAYWRPGMIARFKAEMAKPAGTIHFCGEHTADSTRGLEGALESGERVATEVLATL
jgi:monoamine oxidase